MNENNSTLSEEEFGSGADPCEDSDVTLTNQIVRSSLYVAAMLVSVLANTLLICVVRRNRRMRTVTHHLIVNMAVADLLITVLHMPYMLQVHITGSNQLHVQSGILATIICKVAGFSQDLSISCSVLSLVAIASDRFFAILFPLRKVVALSRASRVIAAVWLVSLLVCSPLLYANKVEQDGEEVYCAEDWAPVFDNDTASRDFTVVLFVFLYACPLVVICVLYSSIVWRVWRRTVLSHAPRGAQRRRSTRKKVLKLLIIIVCVFVICWLPYHVLFFMAYFSDNINDCFPSGVVQFVCSFFAHVNSAINPCLYFVILKEYRRGLREALCCQGKSVARNRENSIPLSGTNTRFRFAVTISRKYTITKPSSNDRAT